MFRVPPKKLLNIRKQFHSFNLSEQDSFSLRNAKEQKSEFIRKHGFIGCKFKESVGDNRCEGLLSYELVESLSLAIQTFRVLWVHKLSMETRHSSLDELTPLVHDNQEDRIKLESNFDKVQSEPFVKRTKGASKFKVSHETLRLLESNETNFDNILDIENL